MQCDIAVIGGGPAGLAAALRAKRGGAGRVLLIERDVSAGGILRQCVHDGFGLHRFNKRMTGGQYAQAFIDELETGGVELMLDTMVLEITPDRTVYAVSEEAGMTQISCGAIILAMGCRERTRNQVLIFGTRPSGVLTAGAVQRYINIEGYLPGKKAVILGSGDIGLIMARRMTLEGMEVEGVYEVMPHLGGLRRNAVQCLDDYGIPLHLSTTVTQTHGLERLEGVTVAQVDENRKPLPETARHIPCDLLVLAVGLLPENELSQQAGIEMDAVTGGPVLDDNYMTSVPGIFAAGNVAAVFDLVDYVSETGEAAADGAMRYLRGEIDCAAPCVAIGRGEGVHVVVPQRVRAQKREEPLAVYLRVARPMGRMELLCADGGDVVYRKRHEVALPPEMLSARIPLEKRPQTLELSAVEVKA